MQNNSLQAFKVITLPFVKWKSQRTKKLHDNVSRSQSVMAKSLVNVATELWKLLRKNWWPTKNQNIQNFKKFSTKIYVTSH